MWSAPGASSIMLKNLYAAIFVALLLDQPDNKSADNVGQRERERERGGRGFDESIIASGVFSLYLA